MIIGNSFAGSAFGRSNGIEKSTEYRDSERQRAEALASNNNKPTLDPASAPQAQPAYRFNSYGNNSVSRTDDSGSSMSMLQTARIVAQIAFRQQVDDVSAYALLGTPDQGSDQFRQVAAAYGDNTD